MGKEKKSVRRKSLNEELGGHVRYFLLVALPGLDGDVPDASLVVFDGVGRARRADVEALVFRCYVTKIKIFSVSFT